MPPGAPDLVLAGVEDGVAGLMLNCPRSRDAWTLEVAEAYHDALDRRAAGRGRHGACSGLGLAEALACDIRFASRSATFCLPYASWDRPLPGMVAWLLPRVLGAGWALDLALSGRELSAEDAAHIGLVQGVSDDGELTDPAVSYARELGTGAAVAAIKAHVDRSLDAGLAQAIDDAGTLASRLPT